MYVDIEYIYMTSSFCLNFTFNMTHEHSYYMLALVVIMYAEYWKIGKSVFTTLHSSIFTKTYVIPFLKINIQYNK